MNVVRVNFLGLTYIINLVGMLSCIGLFILLFLLGFARKRCVGSMISIIVVLCLGKRRFAYENGDWRL